VHHVVPISTTPSLTRLEALQLEGRAVEAPRQTLLQTAEFLQSVLIYHTETPSAASTAAAAEILDLVSRRSERKDAGGPLSPFSFLERKPRKKKQARDKPDADTSPKPVARKRPREEEGEDVVEEKEDELKQTEPIQTAPKPCKTPEVTMTSLITAELHDWVRAHTKAHGFSSSSSLTSSERYSSSVSTSAERKGSVSELMFYHQLGTGFGSGNLDIVGAIKSSTCIETKVLFECAIDDKEAHKLAQALNYASRLANNLPDKTQPLVLLVPLIDFQQSTPVLNLYIIFETEFSLTDRKLSYFLLLSDALTERTLPQLLQVVYYWLQLPPFAHWLKPLSSHSEPRTYSNVFLVKDGGTWYIRKLFDYRKTAVPSSDRRSPKAYLRKSVADLLDSKLLLSVQDLDVLQYRFLVGSHEAHRVSHFIPPLSQLQAGRHNDVRESNVVFREEDKSTFIDWDLGDHKRYPSNYVHQGLEDCERHPQAKAGATIPQDGSHDAWAFASIMERYRCDHPDWKSAIQCLKRTPPDFAHALKLMKEIKAQSVSRTHVTGPPGDLTLPPVASSLPLVPITHSGSPPRTRLAQ